MPAKIYKKGFTTTPEVVRAKQWFPNRWVHERGFPRVGTVEAVGDVPAYGLIHTDAGDIVVNTGEWVTAGFTGGYAAYPIADFRINYEPSTQFKFH